MTIITKVTYSLSIKLTKLPANNLVFYNKPKRKRGRPRKEESSSSSTPSNSTIVP